MRVVLKLSDPWEMGEELGWPPILATIVHRDGGSWLVEIDQPFDYFGVTYQYLVVSPRHEGEPLNEATSKSIASNYQRTGFGGSSVRHILVAWGRCDDRFRRSCPTSRCSGRRFAPPLIGRTFGGARMNCI